MVAEPGPTTSEKRQTLLNKEQINDDDGEFKSLERADCERLSEQQLAEVATEVIQNEMNKTKIMKNAGNEESRVQTTMKMNDFSVYDSSMEREHDDSDVSVLIKQMCAKSDIISRFVFHLSGTKGMIDKLQHEAGCCMELVRALIRRDRTLNGLREFETKMMNFNEDMSNSVMFIPGVSSPIGAANTT